MRIGFNLPNSGPLSAPAIMARPAQEGEALGYDYLTLTDHVVLPDLKAPGYPYSESGAFYGGNPAVRQEQLVNMAWIAARTERIRLVTAVLVVPHRPAVLRAKMLATLDVLSGGRLVVGVGVGWLAAAFDALGTPPFAERGAVTDGAEAGAKVALTISLNIRHRIMGRDDRHVSQVTFYGPRRSSIATLPRKMGGPAWRASRPPSRGCLRSSIPS